MRVRRLPAPSQIRNVMKITSLLENTTDRSDMATEHGLSLYIETEKHNILFDMGQTDLFAKNAETLGIDLTSVDIAIVSHGHYDHGGGLSRFLSENHHAHVYISKYAFEPHYNGSEKYIGLDTSLSHHPQIIFTEDEYKLHQGICLYSCNQAEKKYPSIPSGLTEKREDTFIPDDFRHEQYLLIEENGKQILFSGCSHKGILDIAEWFSPDILIGGFHFSKLPMGSMLTEAAKALQAQKTIFYTCHCTGMEQYKFMKNQMDRLYYLSSGQSIII